MKGKKMRGVLLCTLCLLIVIGITSALNPVDEVEETEEEVTRPIRSSTSTSSSSSSVTTRKRARARHHRRRGTKNDDGEGGGTAKVVQKRRLQSQSGAFRPTRAPLFEASPPDPFIDSEERNEPTLQYGHSHSPPTADPYYSPSKFERERRKRKRVKKVHDASLEPVGHNSFDQGSDGVSTEFEKKNLHARRLIIPQQPEKNYAFAYAVGEEAEDFSHKQAKDGPIAVGEYRVTLPDGRTQVVRYTAGGKHGYKADVTYEAPNGHHQSQHHASGGHHDHQNQQYHASVKPTYHLYSTPTPTVNSNRIYKSRPLKNTALHSNQEIEYSPASSSDDELEYHHPSPQPTPRIRIKTGGRIPQPSPTAADLLNGVSSTPTPRPNSIYDKISPYRNGDKYSGSDELAYAHENSPRAGPVRSSKSKKIAKVAQPTQPTYYDSPIITAAPQLPRKINHSPTKKYKDQGYYVNNGAAAHHHPRAHQANDQFVRQHVQYLQETPIRHHSDSGILIAKPIKEPDHHVLPLNTHYSKPELHAPIISYTPQPVVVRKPKKLKKIKHGMYSPVGQYLIQSPVHVTVQTPLHHQPHHQPHHQQHHHVTAFPTHGPPGFHSHYYNSLHEPRHHSFDQLSPSPTPVTSVRHSESPLPNAYPVTAFPHTGNGGSFEHEQPRLHFPTPTQSGHFYEESPASGDRPNRLKIKEALSRLPVDDLPTPKTTIHPYEVGSADFGKSVAYGNVKGRDGYSPFPTGGLHSFDHLDPTNSLYNSVTSPSGGGFTSGSTGGSGQSYYAGDDQFNFLDGFHNFDIEQANVRQIRQNRPTRSGSKGGRSSRNSQSSSRRAPRLPDKRQGAPAKSSEEEVTQPPTSRQRQKKTTSQPPPRPQPTQPTTNKNRGRRRRVRTQQPDPMMHAVESRRSRPTSTSRSNNNSNSRK